MSSLTVFTPIFKPYVFCSFSTQCTTPLLLEILRHLRSLDSACLLPLVDGIQGTFNVVRHLNGMPTDAILTNFSVRTTLHYNATFKLQFNVLWLHDCNLIYTEQAKSKLLSRKIPPCNKDFANKATFNYKENPKFFKRKGKEVII